MHTSNIIHAAIILIGDELLSGRTQDSNLAEIAVMLNQKGIQIKEARIIGDDEATIIDVVRHFSKQYHYVITTGGIGPTHDDITSPSIAKAFNVKWLLNQDAYQILFDLSKAKNIELNEARLRMAHLPDGATLIKNPMSGAPGFKIKNVFSLAGVPSIMRAMLPFAIDMMEHGTKMISLSLSCNLPEGTIAAPLKKIEQANPNVSIGSYPRFLNAQSLVSLVVRSFDEKSANQAFLQIRQMITQLSGQIIENMD
ncbi:MAG: molybdopterin-binding protein [Pseudomonadota bacterium]